MTKLDRTLTRKVSLICTQLVFGCSTEFVRSIYMSLLDLEGWLFGCCLSALICSFHLSFFIQIWMWSFLQIAFGIITTVKPLLTDTSITRTPLYYGQFVLSQKCQKSYIPYLYNTATSVKRTLSSVPLVSVLKRFDCTSGRIRNRRLYFDGLLRCIKKKYHIYNFMPAT